MSVHDRRYPMKQSEFTRFDFRDLAELRAVDVFQPDLAICGGITEGMRIAALAAAHQIRLAFGRSCGGGQI